MTASPAPDNSPWARVFAVAGLIVLAIVIFLAIPREGEEGEERGFLGGLPGLLLPAPTYTPPVTPTPPATPTPVPQTTAALPTPTATPNRDEVRLRITGNVWCRSGPAVYYEARAGFQPGDQVVVLGQYEGERGAYWLVRTRQGTECWLPKRYTSVVSGDPARLPQITPPPPPAVAFLVGIERVSRCGDRRGLTLWIRNEGTRLLESVDVKIEGPGQAYDFAIGLNQRNGFEWWLTCDAGGRLERLLPGEVGFVTIATPGRDLSGEPVTVTVKACTENHLQGLCLERRLLLPVP